MYVAPEVILGSYNEKIDEWSSGVVLYTMFTGYPPFQSKSDIKETLKLIKLGVYSKDLDEYKKLSNDAKSLITALLTLDPEKRISAVDALHHPWIKKYQKSSKLSKAKNKNKTEEKQPESIENDRLIR